jgi:uncharacterized membrane protein YfcA
VDDLAGVILVAVWCFVVAVLGTSVGLILGSIRLPVLLLFSSSPAAGAGANVGISAVAAATAATTHVRKGTVDWRLAAWMAPASIVGALVGGYASGRLPGDALLVVIGLVLVYFGITGLVRRNPKAVAASRHPARAAAVWGLGIGVLGGLVGLILGTLRVPALVRHLGVPAHRAVATNLVVGFWLGVAGVLGHLSAGVDWGLFLVGAAASIPGAMIGSRLTGRLSERQLLDAIAVVLLAVGVLTALRGLL